MIGRTIAQYRVVAELGGGGMGTVYKAQDLRLERMVALKFLSSYEDAETFEVDNLLREARAAAALNHPNICTVYEVGESDGQPYIAMAYIEGETLTERLKRGPIARDEALRYAVQICEGLREAHDKGVVHRDIKCSNIMVTADKRAIITDFGIAHRVTASGMVGAGTGTGTVSYMSPEQARLERLDRRTDLWSLGVVLYEMLNGQLPFRGEYEAAVLYALLHEDPEPLEQIDDKTGSVKKILAKALAKERDDRFASAPEFLAAMKKALDETRLGTKDLPLFVRDRGQNLLPRRAWLVPIAAIMGVALIGALLWFSAGSSEVAPLPPGERPSLAVLPLDDMSGGDDPAFFADGMTEELITRFGKMGGLRVISRTSVAAYKGTLLPPAQIGDELGVRYLVQGSVARATGRVRIRTHLVDAGSGQNLWSNAYEGPLDDILRLQSRVAEEVGEAVLGKVTAAQRQRLESGSSVDADAYVQYLQARFLLNQRTPTSLAQARTLLEKLTESRPNYGPAFATLADVYGFMAIGGHAPPGELWPRAKMAASRALELDPDDADAYNTLGLVESYYEWDWTGAETAFRRALELNESSAPAHHRMAVLLARLSRHDEAWEEMETATALDPRSANIRHARAVLHYHARRFEAAVRQLESNLETDPDSYRIHWTLGRALSESGQHERAVKELTLARDMSGNNAFMRGALAYGLALAGRDTDAREEVVALQGDAEDGYVSPAGFALAHIGLGEVDEAFDQLGRALHERAGILAWLQVDPQFDSLRSDARFDTLTAAVGFSR